MGIELSERLQLQGGDPLPHLAAFCFRGRAVDGTYPIVPITVAVYAIRFILVGNVPRFAADDMAVGYCEPEYNNDTAVAQHVAYVDRNAGTTTNSLPFYALADVVSVSDTTAADIFCDIGNDINKAPYLQRLYSQSNALRAAAYGTSVTKKRVSIINHFGAVPYVAAHLALHGFDVGGGAAAVLACTAGIGDQVRIPLDRIASHGGADIRIRGFALATNDPFPRYCHIFFSDVCNIAVGGARSYKRPTVMRFDMNHARLEMIQLTNAAISTNFEMHTVVAAERYNTGTNQYTPVTANDFISIPLLTPIFTNGGNGAANVLLQFDTYDFAADIAADNCGLRAVQAQRTGVVFRSHKRISQPICAPVLNPNVRIQCGPPLNFDSRHLPPEMRDFDLLLRDIDFSFLPKPTVGDWQMSNLRSFEFAGGNQVATATGSLLYLPQFKKYDILTTDTTFDHVIYTSNGMPSYIAIYCRYNDRATALNYNISQPRIETLNIACETTKRKSNVITDNLGKHHLFHLTMRNVHPASSYNSTAYNKRQVVLLAAEDIGLMKLKTSDYQTLRRVRFQISGTCNQVGTVHVVLVYNNRGLEINGADIKVVRV
jgi:hypothetical protein